MAKNKKRNLQKVNLYAATQVQPASVRFWNPRRSVIICIAALCLLWVIQFYGIITGGRNLWEDVVEIEYPFRYFTRMAFYQFEFPHWNPFTFGGMPFFATGAGVLYPLNLLLTLLPINDAALWRALQITVVLHILIAGICMFAYLRYKGRSDAASMFGAIAFMFGGYIITHAIHSSITCIVAWLPLQLLFLEKGVRENKPRHAVIGGLLLGAVMQGGHAQVMFYAIILLLSYAVCFIIQAGKQRERLVKRITAAIYYFAIAAGLCLIQYLPIFEASSHTSRIEYTMHQASQGSLQFVQLLTAFMPKVFGAFTGDSAILVFWLQDSFEHGYYNYWETSFYFGISTLILSIFLFRKIKANRSMQFASVWILLSFLIALGGNFFFYHILFSLGIPGFNSFRHTPRILFIWGFLFPLMAAAALDSLNDLKSKNLKIISLSLCGGMAILGIITAAGGLSFFFPLMNVVEARAQYASLQGYILLMNAVLPGIILFLFFKGIIKTDTTKVLIIACLAIDMLSFAAGQHITRREGADVVFGRAKGNVESIKNSLNGEYYRVNTRQFIVLPDEKLGHQRFTLMPRNQGYVSEIEVTEGYNQFRLKYGSLPLDGKHFDRMLDLMNIKYYVNPHFREGDKNVILRNEMALPREKLFYKARIINADNLNNNLNENKDNNIVDSLVLKYMNSNLYEHHGEVVVTEQNFAKFIDNGGAGNVRLIKRKFNRVEYEVDTDREAILWLSETWYPAWKATINGSKTEIHRANYSFRAIIVPAGKSTVVFKFDSPAFNIGALISLLTLIAAVSALVLIVKREK